MRCKFKSVYNILVGEMGAIYEKSAKKSPNNAGHGNPADRSGDRYIQHNSRWLIYWITRRFFYLT